eukprot:TRINITY_DN1929_c0_g1_i2.p1 TRINITY_DN1929_c0_g1~~TRINITY_DN1929_c0_g1_i2.p1  ORF type:complete len:732 (+),score=358.51 TRINITY_DN1929_c0_g1_i2:53-2197(+)
MAALDKGELIAKAENALSQLGIAFQTFHHDAVPTAEDHVRVQGALGFAGYLVKNLFLKDKNKKLYLAVITHDRKIDMKKLGTHLGVGTSGVRFADAESLANVLQVPQGHVTPLAVMNDAEHSVTVLLDKVAAEHAAIGVHPLNNEATTVLAGADLVRFLEHYHAPLTITDFDAMHAQQAAAPAPTKKEKAAATPAPGANAEDEKQKESMLGLQATKEGDFPTWYSQLITRAEMIEYYDVSGCYILRPWAYSIWEEIQHFFDGEIKKLGIKNCYFPMFVSQRALTAEADHIAGFSPEVAWVTKAGQSDLKEPIAIRPTSETIMYPAFANWIRSHRDLPIRLNQWCSVVRWEFKCPTPFLRTREFLWQEGHTAFATKQEADVEVMQILDLYRQVYEDLLAVPVTKGIKTEKEKFAGGLYTTTVEAFIPATGRGIQGATSHCLGQNFANIFDINFLDENRQKQKIWQNSWGLTTRTIGVMIMVHGDNKGLVLPPRVAPIQVVLVPIFYKNTEEERNSLVSRCEAIFNELKAQGVRVHIDDRDNYTAGWKYNHWELKGIPLRIELGPKDMAKQQVMTVRRDNGQRETIAWADLAHAIPNMLNTIHHSMLERAREVKHSRTSKVANWEQFMRGLESGNVVLAPWCEVMACEEDIKKRSGEADEKDTTEQVTETGEKVEKLSGAAKSLCMPFNQPEITEEDRCVGCGAAAKKWCLFGRSY